jgi:hypothetical protein
VKILDHRRERSRLVEVDLHAAIVQALAKDVMAAGIVVATPCA